MAWAPDYTTTDELSDYVRIEDLDDDVQLGLAVTAASRAIDRHTVRQFGLVDAVEPREYTARWSRTRGGWLVPIDDLMTTTGLVVQVDQDGDGAHEASLASTAYVLRPRNAARKGFPWTELWIDSAAVTGMYVAADGAVQVTALWGWSAVPATVEQACLLQASRLLSRRDSPFGVAGSPEGGSELRLLARVDPDVQVTLDPYRRRVWTR